MDTIIKKCCRCSREFESKFDNNFCNSCIEQDREDSIGSTCPACNNEYNDIDIDYQICSRCGFDATEQKFRPGNRRTRLTPNSRYGIDPDVKLDDWS